MGRGAVLELDVMGEVAVRVDNHLIGLSGRPLEVLCHLALARGRTVSRAQLSDALWGNASSGGLKTTINRLRTTLDAAAELVETTPTGYSLRRDGVVVDSERFEAEVRTAAREVSTDPEAAIVRLDRAEGLWRGIAYLDVRDSPPLAGERARLQILRDHGADLRAESLAATGSDLHTVAELVELVGSYPSRERIVAALAVTLYRRGRQVDALRTIHDCRTRLRDEFGLSLMPELVELERNILAHDSALELSDPHRRSAGAARASRSVEVEDRAHAIRGLVGAGALEHALRLALSSLGEARAGGDDAAIVAALCTLARVASLAERGEEARAALDEASRLCDVVDGEARADLALSRYAIEVGYFGDGSLVTTLGQALSHLPRSSPRRVDLLVALVVQLTMRSDSDDPDAVLAEAERLNDVDRIGEPSNTISLARLLVDEITGDRRGSYSPVRPAVADEPPVLLAHLRSAMVHGRLAEASSLIGPLEVAGRRNLEPSFFIRGAIARSAIALAEGELDEIEEALGDWLGRGRRMGIASVEGSVHLQRLALALATGLFDDVIAFVAVARTRDPRAAFWDAIEAVARARTGDIDAADQRLRALGNVQNLPVGWTRTLTAALGLEGAWLVNSVDVAPLSAVLDAHAGRMIVGGHSSAIFGPVDRYRAMAAALSGSPAQAAGLWTAAREFASASGAHHWVNVIDSDLTTARR